MQQTAHLQNLTGAQGNEEDKTSNPERVKDRRQGREPLGPRKAWGLLFALLLTACSSTLQKADHDFDTGAWTTAAAAYENALANDTASAAERGRALFRLALLHALPASPLHDPARAHQLLTKTAATAPPGPYREQARLLLEHEKLRDAMTKLGVDLKSLEEGAGTRSDELAELRRLLAECEEKLEKLKEIDLGGRR